MDLCRRAERLCRFRRGDELPAGGQIHAQGQAGCRDRPRQGRAQGLRRPLVPLFTQHARAGDQHVYGLYRPRVHHHGQRKPGQHARKRPLRHELHFEQHLRRIYPQAWRRPFAQVAGRLEPREEKVPYADHQARRAYRAFETEFRPDGRRDERPCGRGLRLELCRCFLPRELWLQGPVPCRVQLSLRRVVEVPREFEVGFLPLGLGGLAPLGGKVHGLV